jgi:hypothetical protein
MRVDNASSRIEEERGMLFAVSSMYLNLNPLLDLLEESPRCVLSSPAGVAAVCLSFIH